MPGLMEAELIEVVQEAEDVKTLKFRLSEKISFKPGQFIMLCKKTEAGEAPLKRPYSFSHYCKEQPTDEVCVSFNIVPGGKMSTYLYNLEVGAKLDAMAPFGVFCPDEQAESFIFIAAGTGVTPFMTMIESLVNTGKNLTLLYSVRNEKKLLFKEQLNKLAEEKKIMFIPTVTDEQDSEWNGRTGRIDQDLIKEVAKTRKEHAYICGSVEFIDAMIAYLEEAGLPKEQIHVERW